MADYNHVGLIGRLTKDAELKYTGGGFPVANFSIAVNRRRKNGDQWVDEVSFFEINLFGKSAENLAQYLVKGKQLAVDGELRQDRWEKDGQNRSRVYVVANNIQFLGSPAASQGQSYSAQSNQGAPASFQSRPAPTQETYTGSSYDDMDAYQEDTPF